MNLRTRAFALIAGLCASAGIAAGPGLADRLATKQGWVGYRVAMFADAGDPCCLDWNGKTAKRTGCNLDRNHWNFGSNLDDEKPGGNGTLAVYAHVTDGIVDRVHGVSATCPITTARPVEWLEPVAAIDSVAFLQHWLEGRAGARPAQDSGLATLAYHAHPEATRALVGMSAAARPRKVREQALFWLGQARGIEGADFVERVATHDPEPKMRAHAVFALSQSRAGDPYPRIRAISRNDKSEHVRSQALFWMAQTGDRRARKDITAALRKDPAPQVREQAVFALSQLKQADIALIAVLRGDYPRQVKERALFWLGQSGSPKAIEYFDEVLSRAEPRR